MKHCSKCGELKPLNEYYKRKASLDGYHRQCKKCIIAQVSKHYFDNPEPAKQRSKKWRLDNPDWTKANNKNWRENNLEYSKARNHKWREDNKEQHRANSREWAKNNKEKRKAANYKRRAALEQNGIFKISNKEWQKIYDSECVYCGSRDMVQADHVIPVTRGGRHSIGNLVPACRSCNTSKNSKTITEWQKAKRNPR